MFVTDVPTEQGMPILWRCLRLVSTACREHGWALVLTRLLLVQSTSVMVLIVSSLRLHYSNISADSSWLRRMPVSGAVPLKSNNPHLLNLMMLPQCLRRRSSDLRTVLLKAWCLWAVSLVLLSEVA